MATTEESSPGVVGRVGKEFATFRNGISMTGGDIGAWSQLFFDNLSTLLGAVFAIQNMTAFGVDRDVLDNVIFGRIIPGVGITLVIGNIYYSWQAIRLTNKWGRQYTAQPYGLNTPAAFAFVFNIIYTVYFDQLDTLPPNEAFLMGYKVALAANFITGLISVFLGFFGRAILKAVPPAALLVPIAGIGIAFLGLDQLSHSIAAPLVGYACIIWVYLGWYAGIKVGFGAYRLPEACMVIIVGVVLGWATGLNKGEDVEAAAKLVKWWGPVWSGDDLFSQFSLVKDYLGIVIPIGISAASTTLMCLVSAKEAGDPFPVRESMITDGIGTMLASFFGSPFGTVIYIGHPAYKKTGAKVGYSLANGLLYLIFAWFGILALMQSIVNRACIGPIVFFVGVMVNEETLNFIPSRHYSAYIIGLFPSLYDWMVNISGRAPLTGFSEDGGMYNTEFPAGSDGFIGAMAWKNGSLLVSMVWTAMVVGVLDRKWIQSLIWALVGALLSVFGVIHVPQAGFKTFNEPTYHQCAGFEDDAGLVPAPSCWENAKQWMFFVAYCILAGTFALISLAKKFDDTIEDEIEDESAHAFDDWFKDAAKGAEDTDEENEAADEITKDKELASSEEDVEHGEKEVDEEE